LIVVVGRGHQLASKRLATIEEIGQERMILFERGASIRHATDDFFKRVGIRPDLALESNDTYFIKLMVEHGMGISLLPAWAVLDEVSQGKLARLRISGHHLRRSVAMVSLGRFQPSPMRAFHAYILHHQAKLQDMARGGMK
jgi:DNA-binding transcriptional LysR family regulator